VLVSRPKYRQTKISAETFFDKMRGLKGGPMSLSRNQIKKALKQWKLAWDNHDLAGVMNLFHEAVVFENWTGGTVRGKAALRKAWEPWFANHGNFRFVEEDTFIDEKEQKVLYRWLLEWPSLENGHEGRHEKRRGVDVMHFKDGKIINKYTYSKTTVEIDGQRRSLHL
jgi:ketosteroid isomerase-like protein